MENPLRESSIPEHAKRVFRGKLFEVWQWEQKLYDGTTAVFERLKRPDTVVAIPTVGEKIIIERQLQPDSDAEFISFPSGRADQSGDMLAEAKRELLEETGYASDDWRLWYTETPHHKIDWKVYVYLARNCRRTAGQHLDPGERIAAELISFDEMLALADDPRLRGGRLVELFLRMRLDPRKKEEFRKMLFG